MTGPMIPEPIYQRIGRRIAAARARRGITQEMLAFSLTPPLTRSALCNMELGRQRIMIHVLVDIADALGTTVARLIR